MQGSTQFNAAIAAYLDKRATEDSQFAKKYANKKKSIEECCRFILGEVEASKRCGFTDDEIYSMAVHYYDEDQVNIKPNRISKVVSPEANPQAKTEPEKAQVKKAKPKPEPKPERTFIQLDMFGDMEGDEQ